MEATGRTEHDQLVAALRAAIEARGGRLLVVDADDCAHVAVGDVAGRIYLDNLRRRAATGEPVAQVAAQVAEAFTSPRAFPGSASEQRAGLRLALERREVVVPFEREAVQQEISGEIALVLAWTDGDETGMRFMTADVLAAWSLSPAEAWTEAGQRMDALLAQTPIEVNPVAGSRLAMLATDSIFKASLVAAPSLRRHIEPLLGWPVMAVVPCRDFIYLLPDDAHDLVSRLGAVVMREFTQSPYPLSPELFAIADSGISALGRFGDP